MNWINCKWLLYSALLAGAVHAAPAASKPGLLDTISFGDAGSETSHALTADHSQTVTGGLGEPARILLPKTDPAWAGGQLAFTLRVDPVQTNYATLRLWGSDATKNQLVLFCEGKQVGYRHLGDVDLLDIGGEEAAFPGRFIYTTTPLPLALTRGRTNLNFEIRSYGPIWGYASEFEKYQKAMAGPTRGLYRFYTHTDGCFVPPADEKQGEAPATAPVRATPGDEVMVTLKTRVNDEINRLLASTQPLNEMQMQFLARAYGVKWTPAYKNRKVVARVIQGLDALYLAYRENPELAHNDPTTPNPGWFEFGPAGETISLLAAPLGSDLDGQLTTGSQKLSRRQAYAEMLVTARDWHRQHRRLYSNQTMIQDWNIYLSNRGLAVVSSAQALPESVARRYLYEAIGLEPWRDSDPGPASSNWGVGTNYWQLTAKGLTKELGYVGYYGEVLDWVTMLYDSTRPAPGLPGDEKIRQQLIKIANARAVFRYPATDADGYRAMRIEAVVGWRDAGHYPGNVAYAERATWDASTLYAVAAMLDPKSIGYAQQMFADGQFFNSLKQQLAQNHSLRVTAGLLGVPEQYDLVQAQAPSPWRLPMTPGQPDFVFSDEEDGVVAIKNGDEILYASLYWRARHAVNFLARVHFTTPHTDQIAVVGEAVEFTPSGQFYTRPDHINFGFANGGPKYPGEMHSALAGEQLPIAKVPAEIKFKPGDESVFAGKGDFYALTYGHYLIGMNLTLDKTFELKPPAGVTEAKELVSGKSLNLTGPLWVGPRSTVVLYWGP